LLRKSRFFAFWRQTDRQTNRQTDEQMDSIDALSPRAAVLITTVFRRGVVYCR